jgi:hypothetical protein
MAEIITNNTIPTPPNPPAAEQGNRYIRFAVKAAAVAALTSCGVQPTTTSVEAIRVPEAAETSETLLHPSVKVEQIIDAETFIAADKARYPYKEGYMRFQGDAVNSYTLADGRIVTLRSDTWVFNEEGEISEITSIPRNTAACYDPTTSSITSLNEVTPFGEVESFYPRDISPAEQEPFMKREKAKIKAENEKKGVPISEVQLTALATNHYLHDYPKNTFEWQASGFAIGNKIHAFTFLMESDKDRNDPWNFQVVGTKYRVLDFGESGCDTVSFEEAVDTPATAQGPEGIMWGAGSVYDEKDGYAYIIGNQQTDDKYVGQNYFAARALPNTIDDIASWQYWDGEKFVDGQSAKMKPLFTPNKLIKDAIDLKVDPRTDEFVLTYHKMWPDDDSNTTKVFERRGKDAVSAFQAEAKEVGELPADLKGYFGYLPAFHAIEGDNNEYVAFTTASINNVKDPAALPLYGMHTLEKAGQEIASLNPGKA